MGQTYSQPQDGAEVRVIGAGLSRTGTASFSRALEILLDGPVFHGGTQIVRGPEAEIKSWIKLLAQWPPHNEAIKRENLQIIRARTKGFVAVTDTPGCGLVSELMTLYPNAKVICTVRDAAAWEKSMAGLSSAVTQSALRFILFPLPTMRYFVEYANVLIPQWDHLYGERDPPTVKTYHRHIEWLKEIVPPNQLVFFDVRDGWEPLCQALNLPVPKDVPFPRINDATAIDDFAKSQVARGLKVWLMILVTAGLAIAVPLILMKVMYWPGRSSLFIL
jgi:hypothetical protein